MARTRQLAAIMFSHIDGYAVLMQQDEAKADILKEKYNLVFHRAAEEFHGKILKNIGHDSLSLYSSAVEAVQCAIEMQFAFNKQAGVPVKIGIHLGDIIYSEEEAIGEGIAVAQKIAGQAIPGGILISGKIREEIKNQREIGTSFFKKCTLEELDQQIDIYAVSCDGVMVPEQSSASDDTLPEAGSRKKGLLAFWKEAKRRNLIRVVSFYAAGAFAALELSSIIKDPLNLPPWFMNVMIILVSSLFVVVAIFSWIYDITPEGIVKTPPLHEQEEVKPDMQDEKEKKNWFARHKVFRRFLVPLVVFALLFVFIQFKDRIFENRIRVNKVALEHTSRAKLFINNRADPELVRHELDLALEADPDYAPALYTYAMLHRLEGDSVSSKQKLHRIVEANPGFSEAWNLLASFAFWQDSFELAMGYSIKAIEADPGNRMAAYNMAIQSEDRGLHIQAVEWYRKAILMDSTFIPGYSALGALYNKMNRPTEAILTLHKSLHIAPVSIDNYRVYKNLAEAHFLLREYGLTLEYLEESKALKPDYADTERCYARFYESLGEIETSVLHWRRYLALETDSFKLQESEKHLDSLRLTQQK